MEKNKELTLSEIQQASFNILLKLKEIFDKNDWKYYLAYGTLLGCIRHGGFIPWDDDIDIWVPRSDYEKFINYCIEHKEELLPFELMHYKTNKKYIYTIARFSDSRYTTDYKNVKNYGLGVFVDIYPLDGIDINDKKIWKKIMRLLKLINISNKIKYENVKSKSLLKNIIKYSVFLILKVLHLKNFLIKKNDIIAQKYDFEKSDNFSCVVWTSKVVTYNKKVLEKENFKDFNGETFRIPYDYDDILKKSYGNYMELPPENQRIPHHEYTVTKK